MAWATNTAHQVVVSGLPTACKTTYNTWAQAINTGKDPKTAANTWDSDYEVLKRGTSNGKQLKYCSVRLSQEHRVYFIQNDADKICDIRKVGSHLKPSGF